jgi:hypothetical protein
VEEDFETDSTRRPIIKPQLKLFWLIVLLIFISDCSGYQVACNSLSEVSTRGGEEFGRNCDLEPGDNVRINLMDGKQELYRRPGTINRKNA